MLIIVFFTDSKKVRNYFPLQACAAITHDRHATPRQPFNRRQHHDARPRLRPRNN